MRNVLIDSEQMPYRFSYGPTSPPTGLLSVTYLSTIMIMIFSIHTSFTIRVYLYFMNLFGSLFT